MERSWSAPANTYVSVTGTRLRETDKAVQFSIHSISGSELDEPHTMWIPFSQVQKSLTDPTKVGEDSLVVADWILKKAELI